VPKISIVITNHNYGRFLRQAIDSALAMDCSEKEIIVSDDGSTDNSHAIIDSYGERIVAIKKRNNGQCSAFNSAFPYVSGQIVFLLDSDDVYLPNAAKEVIAVWRPGVSKVQFPLLNMDSNGALFGTMFPNFAEAFPPSYIREALITTGLPPTAPTTGNAYDVGTLGRVWPVPENGELAGIDGYLNVAAPLYGDVITLTRPLGCYRFHGSNVWAQSKFSPEKLAFYVEQERRRTRYLCRLAAAEGIEISETVLNNNTHHQMYRMGCRKALGAAGAHGSLLEIWYHGLGAVLRDRLSARAKLLICIWFTLVAVSPRPLACHFIKQRFVAISRSGRMIRFMQMMGVLKIPQGLPH
jgi:glycosyltransferase involved in cell wall biosynthesis